MYSLRDRSSQRLRAHRFAVVLIIALTGTVVIAGFGIFLKVAARDNHTPQVVPQRSSFTRWPIPKRELHPEVAYLPTNGHNAMGSSVR
jgi:hypothetical protein